jgi:hypothetical protein
MGEPEAVGAVVVLEIVVDWHWDYVGPPCFVPSLRSAVLIMVAGMASSFRRSLTHSTSDGFPSDETFCPEPHLVDSQPEGQRVAAGIHMSSMNSALDRKTVRAPSHRRFPVRSVLYNLLRQARGRETLCGPVL